MLTICWAAKGGSGTTVFTAASALSSRSPALLIDLDGDLPAVLGLPDPEGPGVYDWLRSDASADRLANLELRVNDDVELIGVGRRGPIAPERWLELAGHLATDVRHVFVDAGSSEPPEAIRRVADRALLVTRACYLSMTRAVGHGIVPTGVVLVREPGRRLTAADIEASVGAPVVTTVLLDPAIARAADAGLLTSRLPGGMRRQLAA